MARARSIKPGFFKNEKLSELSPVSRLLFAGLWTIADREGRLEDRPKRIKAEIFPYEDKVNVERSLKELADQEFIIRYGADGDKFIAILTWRKHQKPHQKESPSVIPEPPPRSVPGPEKVVSSPEKARTSPAGTCSTLYLNPVLVSDDPQPRKKPATPKSAEPEVTPIRKAIETYAVADDLIARRVLQESIGADSEVTIETVALAVHASVAPSTRVDSAGLFLTTVPALIRSDPWKFMRRFVSDEDPLPERMSEAQGVLRDNRAPEVVKRFLRLWIQSERAKQGLEE